MRDPSGPRPGAALALRLARDPRARPAAAGLGCAALLARWGLLGYHP